jgi:hypothetical protein
MQIELLTPEQAEALTPIIEQLEEDYPEFSACSLGSCQYKSIEDVANFASAIINDPLLGWETFLKLFPGIKIPESIPTAEEFAEELRQEVLACYAEHDHDEDDEEVLQYAEAYYEKEGTTLETYYELTKHLAWDLWSATILPFDPWVDPDKNPLNLPVQEGPLLNKMAWAENERIGFEIAIAMHLYNTDLSEYAEYDT